MLSYGTFREIQYNSMLFYGNSMLSYGKLVKIMKNSMLSYGKLMELNANHYKLNTF
jgi:hypothetical protein